MDARKQIKFLSYNVWSREDAVVYKRVQAIGGLVEKHDPDVIFFQEVTPYIRSIFESFAWWEKYNCSPVFPEEQAATTQPFCLLLSKLPMEAFARWKFANSPTGRAYLEADINPDPATMKPIRIATAQLERARPPAPMHCMERYAQAEHAVAALSSADNAVFGGDMCWRDGTDRPFPLPADWFDAWTAWNVRGGAVGRWWGTSWTYDAAWEEEVPVVNGYAYISSYQSMRMRSNRFVCKLKDYSLSGLELIGELIEGNPSSEVIRYGRSRKNYYLHEQSSPSLTSFKAVPLGPSCHHGLLLTIVPNEPARPIAMSG